MELEIYTEELGSPRLADDFMQKKVHLVCVAVNSLTNFNAFATMEGGITDILASALARKVCRENETGTLYPKLSMTIVPLTATAERDDYGNRALMVKHISDCFKANEEYVRCPSILFALEDRDDFDYQLAMDVLRELVESEDEFSYTKKVFYYPYN